MKYKVGDKVIIKSEKELKDMYESLSSQEFLDEIPFYGNKKAFITSIVTGFNNEIISYKTNIDNGKWDWVDRDFDDLLETMLRKSYEV